MSSPVYCKVCAIDGIHFVKVEKGKFTFNWLCENYIKRKQKMATCLALAYDDLSGDRVLLSNEEEFQLMLEMMDDIGANMVKLYVTTITKKKGAQKKKLDKNRELLRGGSFGIFNVKRLTGCDKVETASDSEKTFSKTLANAFAIFMDLEHCRPINVAEINVKRVGGSLKVVCYGRLGHPDLNMVVDKYLLTPLDDEPKKCAWLDKEKNEGYILEFLTEEDRKEFYEKVSEMTGQPLQAKKTN